MAWRLVSLMKAALTLCRKRAKGMSREQQSRCWSKFWNATGVWTPPGVPCSLKQRLILAPAGRIAVHALPGMLRAGPTSQRHPRVFLLPVVSLLPVPSLCTQQPRWLCHPAPEWSQEGSSTPCWPQVRFKLGLDLIPYGNTFCCLLKCLCFISGGAGWEMALHYRKTFSSLQTKFLLLYQQVPLLFGRDEKCRNRHRNVSSWKRGDHWMKCPEWFKSSRQV